MEVPGGIMVLQSHSNSLTVRSKILFVWMDSQWAQSSRRRKQTWAVCCQEREKMLRWMGGQAPGQAFDEAAGAGLCWPPCLTLRCKSGGKRAAHTDGCLGRAHAAAAFSSSGEWVRLSSMGVTFCNDRVQQLTVVHEIYCPGGVVPAFLNTHDLLILPGLPNEPDRENLGSM